MDLPDEPVTISRESPTTAAVRALKLRGGDNVRLVFVPQLVENAAEPGKPVKGSLLYQRKRPSGAWEPVAAISLASLRADEGVRIALNCDEIDRLRTYLNVLFDHFEGSGLIPGQRKYKLIDDRSPLFELETALERADTPDALRLVTTWLGKRSFEEIVKHAGALDDGTLALDAALGVGRLTSFITQAEWLLESNDESAWQRLLSEQSWVVSQVFAEPLVFVCGQAYLGGKTITNQGGTLADFLYRNQHTGNCMIVEIKTPIVPFIQHDRYERNNSINVSSALSGVSQQVLGDRAVLLKEYDRLARAGDTEATPIDPKMLVVIGRLEPLSRPERESFERYRANLANVIVVTFDELVAKVRTLLDLLRGSTGGGAQDQLSYTDEP